MSVDDLIVELAPRVRAGLVAAYGVEAGCEAAAVAVTWALEHQDRVAQMENPAGYLYRVGQTSARRSRTPMGLLPEVPSQEMPDIEPGLIPALEELTDQQRLVVVMVHALGWSQVEVGELLDVSASTVAAHLRRGMESLRESLEVVVDGR
jgi:DNA-directed RNA polymerase specialized sigma24 family protein